MKTKNTLFATLFLSLLFFAFTLADRTISGKITNSKGNPIASAVIQLKGTSIKTLSNSAGEYKITVPTNAKILIFSYPEKTTVQRTIGKSDVINVRLFPEEDIFDLDEAEEALPSLSEKRKALTRGKAKPYKKAKLTTSGTTFVTESFVVFDEPVDGIIGDLTTNEQKKSGQLTAGEIHDFSKWKMWGDISDNELKSYRETWKIKPEQRYSVQLKSKTGMPIINAEVQLIGQNDKLYWTARTDNTGKAELWLGLFSKESTSKLKINVNYQGKNHTIKRPTQFHKGINILEIDATCNIPANADIVFVVDATGSMSDEIAYLKAEITDVIGRVKKEHKGITVKLGSVFYRDHKDAYLVRSSDLDTDISKTTKFIAEQYAGGGGDYPEAVEEGLESAINQMSWSKDARAKIIFLVLDAPPHQTPEITAQLAQLIKTAAKKGIRIVPITASGINKSTEYLMRSMALATNGTYVFITDDSGIGGSHIKPTTDKFKVELLNDLLVRLAHQYLITPDCSNLLPEEIVAEADTMFIVENTQNKDSANLNKSDTTGTTTAPIDFWQEKKEVIKYYPNPTSDIVNIELLGEVKAMYLADISGKILERFDTSNKTQFTMSIGRYPSGIYFIQYLSGEQWKTGKVILRH